ncbi:hypothetical protein BD413DRAFT_505470 [Trametes elegans]|nr:hypothetical protein BD413DRAFT_505470 [Trametes elegans]
MMLSRSVIAPVNAITLMMKVSASRATTVHVVLRRSMPIGARVVKSFMLHMLCARYLERCLHDSRRTYGSLLSSGRMIV